MQLPHQVQWRDYVDQWSARCRTSLVQPSRCRDAVEAGAAGAVHSSLGSGAPDHYLHRFSRASCSCFQTCTRCRRAAPLVFSTSAHVPLQPATEHLWQRSDVISARQTGFASAEGNVRLGLAPAHLAAIRQGSITSSTASVLLPRFRRLLFGIMLIWLRCDMDAVQGHFTMRTEQSIRKPWFPSSVSASSCRHNRFTTSCLQLLKTT